MNYTHINKRDVRVPRSLIGLVLFTALSVSATAQTQTFTKDGLEYAIDFPSPSWGPISRVDVHEHFEFVNGDDYGNGYLRLRKKLVEAGTVAEEIFREDEKWELQRLPGYVVCSDGMGTLVEGHVRGTVFSYEYVNRGMSMDGRIYYLKLDNRTFYVLHFTVTSAKLRSLRGQMDSIARSFRLK
jgi:hypothetical protein